MASTTDVTDQTFEAEVETSELPVLVDFWAPWCGPCRQVAPIVEAIAEKYQGRVKVGKVNVDENRQVAARFQIMAIPMIGVFVDGQMVDQLMGAVPQSQIEEALKRAMNGALERT